MSGYYGPTKDEFDEPVLEDDYPIYPGYLYVNENGVVMANERTNVDYLKRKSGSSEIRRCDIVSRDIPL